MEELENEISTQAEENTVSLASAQALVDALAKIEVYTPTTWVDNSSPDIDAEHLNKPEQAIKRVTDALNSAVDVIKDLQSQVTKNSGAISDVNNNLSNVQNRFYKKTDKTDFNDLTTNGYYYGVLTSNTPDGTTTANWVVEVQTFDNNPLYVFQRAVRVSDKRIFTRHREGKTIGWKNWEILATKSDLNNIVTSENIKSISFTAGEIKTLTVKTNCNDYVPCIVKERTNGKPLMVANFWSETSDVSKIILYAPLLTTNANIDIYFIKRYW